MNYKNIISEFLGRRRIFLVNRKTLIVFLGSFADFDSFEYAQQLSSQLNKLAKNSVDLILIGIGSEKSKEYFCRFNKIDIKNVIETVDVKTIYEAPISFYKEKLDVQVLNYFRLKSKKPANLNPWKKITKIILQTKKQVNIAIIGKYVELKDAYKSLDEALTHGGIENRIKVNLVRIDSEKLKASEISSKLKNISGILIPGGFGKRGTDGKIAAIKYARNNKIPFLGICYGMQMAIIEFARNKLNLKKATSSEFDKKGLPVIGLINEWIKDGKTIKGTDKDLGGTMRLGSYEAKLKDNSLIRKLVPPAL